MVILTMQEFCDFLGSGHTETISYTGNTRVNKILKDSEPTSFFISQSKLNIGFEQIELENYKIKFWESF